MKNIFKYILVMVALFTFVYSCTTFEYEEPNTGAGIARAVNSLNLGLADEVTQVRINDTVTFSDTSLESDDRLWTIIGSSVDILGSNNDASSAERNFTAIFKQTGEVQALLEPNFQNSVVDSISSILFEFNVLPLVVANFTTNIPSVNGQLVVEAGEDVTFTNTSSELENAEWTFTNLTTGVEVGTFEDVEAVTTRFGSVGTYSAFLRAFSEMPFSQGIRTLQFSVVPSSQPLTIEPGIFENESAELVLAFSRDLDPSNLDPVNNFELIVDGAPAEIGTTRVDPTNPSNLLVRPTVNIKNTQTASLSYTRSTLTSSDGIAAPSFSASSVTPFSVNLFPKGDFEAASTNNYDVNNGFLGISAGQVQADFTDGIGVDNSRAMVFSSVAGAIPGSRRILFGDKDSSDVNILTPVEDGVEYIITMKVRYTGVIPDEINFGFIRLPFSGPSRVQITLDANLIEGEFVDARGEFTVNSGTAPDMYALPNVTIGGGPSEIIYDDVKVFRKDL